MDRWQLAVVGTGSLRFQDWDLPNGEITLGPCLRFHSHLAIQRLPPYAPYGQVIGTMIDWSDPLRPSTKLRRNWNMLEDPLVRPQRGWPSVRAGKTSTVRFCGQQQA